MRAGVKGSLFISLLVGCNAILGNESPIFVGDDGGSGGSGGTNAGKGGAPSNGGGGARQSGGTGEPGSSGGSAGSSSSNGGSPSGGSGTSEGGADSGSGGDASSETGGMPAAGGMMGAGGASSTGGSTLTGGTSSSGGTSNGGAKASGGAATGGTTSGGTKSTGGTSTGGTSTGGTKSTGGTSSGGTGTGGSPPIVGPCDIYASASTPCVAAYSTTRVLAGSYQGKLYQVRKAGNRNGTGGTLADIGTVAGGYADAAAQDLFCGSETCTISKLYDQSGKGNDLTVAPAGCSSAVGPQADKPDFEANAKRRALTLNGHAAYALSTAPNGYEGYRRNSTTGMPTGTAAQGIYEVADGQAYGTECCWDFGNVSTDNCYTSTPSTLFFGTAYWGQGAGAGPWFMADFEAGVWAGGSDAVPGANLTNPSMSFRYAFGLLKTSATNYAIRVANAQSGSLTTAYDGPLPKALNMKGGIVLGVAQDNSNNSFGTFYEGAITSGRPSDATDALVHANVIAAGYGK